jgi:hypothetical protein
MNVINDGICLWTLELGEAGGEGKPVFDFLHLMTFKVELTMY